MGNGTSGGTLVKAVDCGAQASLSCEQLDCLDLTTIIRSPAVIGQSLE